QRRLRQPLRRRRERLPLRLCGIEPARRPALREPRRSRPPPAPREPRDRRGRSALLAALRLRSACEAAGCPRRRRRLRALVQLALKQRDELAHVGGVRYLRALEPHPEPALAREDQHHVNDRVPPLDNSGSRFVAEVDVASEHLLEDALHSAEDLLTTQAAALF